MRLPQRIHFSILATTVLLLCWQAACSLPVGSSATDSMTGAPPSHRPEYERHVRSLSSKSPTKAQAAWSSLSAAGMDAIPTLLAHFDDKALAAPIVSGARLGPITVGHVCFEILQMQIEAAWPKNLHRFHVLTPANAHQWLEAHRGMALEELRRIASREAVARAEAALSADPSNERLQKAVAYLKKRDSEISSER